MINGKNIVITGGAGFIGSNLARVLAKENKVIVIDDLSTGNLENINDLINNESINFIKGSITDIDLLKDIFKNIDYIFHQAAIPSVPRSIKDPIRSNRVNVNGTLNVLVAARDNKVKKVIYASSSSVYGDTPVLPKKEDMKPIPLSPYAISKLVGEYYCRVFTKVYGLSCVSLRYFNVYGPYQDPSSEYAAVVPRFISRVLKDESPIIFGDGNQTRDLTFIGNVVNANILASENNINGVFNIACGERISINKLATVIMKMIGKNLEIIYEDTRPGDVKYSHADISKAKEKLGYVPTFDLNKGLEETLKWFFNKERKEIM
jgi:UDP-glucose 4-epimerase